MRKLYALVLFFSFLSFIGIFSSCKKGPLAPESYYLQPNLYQTPYVNSDEDSTVHSDSTEIRSSTIVILGSSTAEGTGASHRDSSWAGLLRAFMGPSNSRIINLGRGSYTTFHVRETGFKIVGRPLPDTARNVTKALSLDPGLVIINLPTNDIAYGYSSTEILENFKAIVAKLDSAGVEFIITCTQPRNLDSAGRARLKEFNNSLVKQFEKKICDYFDILSTADLQIKPEYSFGDGVHLNNAGHRIIYSKISNFPIFLTWMSSRMLNF